MSACYECCVLLRRGLCDELTTRPEESYRLWCVAVCVTRVETVIVATIYLQLIQNRYMFRILLSFTVVSSIVYNPFVASDVEVVGYL